jgi:hypothetical protein
MIFNIILVLVVGFYVAWLAVNVWKTLHNASMPALEPGTIDRANFTHTSTDWQGVNVGWQPHDIWLGVYWKFEEIFDGTDGDHDRLTLYICPLPCYLITLARVRTYQLVPKVTLTFDKLCLDCGKAESEHPIPAEIIKVGGLVKAELFECTGKY